MSTLRQLGFFAMILCLALFNYGCDGGAGNSSGTGASGTGTSGTGFAIGRMKVAIMPEYDEPSVLAIYDGRFEEASSYPIKTSFLIPRGSVISDACSLSHEGQHFCQLYKTVNRGDYDEVSLLLPYPNFYLSFHTPQLDVKREKKELVYLIKANHPIKTLEVDIQQPLRSSAFNIFPPGGAAIAESNRTLSVIRGFNHFTYKLDGVARGQESAFKIAYLKSDPKPSVDIKFTSMENTPTRNAPYETQRNIKTVIYVIFGSGALGVLAVVAWFIRARKKKRGGAS